MSPCELGQSLLGEVGVGRVRVRRRCGTSAADTATGVGTPIRDANDALSGGRRDGHAE
jgi:hypothetical protein